jgi:RNA polymerase sigma-70 factor, ECF subfamily
MGPLIAREKPPPFDPHPSDEELVRRITAGETALFEQVMRRHNRKMFRAVRSILRDSAEVEDVIQQAYLSAYTHLGSFAGNAKLSTWLLRIAVNEALGRLRRARRQHLVELRPDDGEEGAMSKSTTGMTPEQACSDRELASIIESAVDALPDRYRSVFMFRQIEGLSTAETAAVLEITPDVVKTRLHRARSLLHGRLAALGHDEMSSAFSFDGARCDRIVARVLERIAQSAG